jgi:integrase
LYCHQRCPKSNAYVQDAALRQAAIYFLLGCYTGLRISDWIRFNPEEHLRDDLLTLRNGEHVAMPVSMPLARNLKRMADCPLTIEEPTINEKLKVIAKDPQVKIRKSISTHVGRHTFAITLCAEMGVSLETCAELMGITVATCAENYYKVTGKKIREETLKAWKGLWFPALMVNFALWTP